MANGGFIKRSAQETTRAVTVLAALTALLGVAAWARLSLIGYGLPFLLWEDEPIYFRRALNLGFGDWNPHYFKKPGFFLYFYYTWYWLAYQLGDWPHWQAFIEGFWRDPSRLTLLGRSISAAMGVATVGLTYWLGRRLGGGRWAAISGAALLALYPIHIQYSAIVVSDTPALLCVVGCAIAAIDVQRKGRWRDYLLCGALAGLAIAFKYNFFTFVLPLAAHGARVFSKNAEWRARLRLMIGDCRIWGALAAATLTFLTLCPYTLLDFRSFWTDFDLERRHVLLRQADHATRRFLPMAGAGKTFLHILPKALGWPLALAAVMALATGLFRVARPKRLPRWTSALAFTLMFLLAASQFRLVNAKYLLPTAPFLALAITLWLEVMARGMARRWRLPRPWTMAAATVFLALLALPMLSDAGNFLRRYQQPDARTRLHARLSQDMRAQEWALIEPEALPLGAPAFPRPAFVLAIRPQTAHGALMPIRDVSQSPLEAMTRAQWLVMRVKPLKGPNKRRILPYSLSYYQAVASQFTLTGVFAPALQATAFASPAWSPSEEPLEARLLSHYPVWDARKNPGRGPGPILLLWRRK